MTDRDDQSGTPENEPTQARLKELYGRLFGIAFRHRNTRVDEHVKLEGPRELPPSHRRPGDEVAHSYSVAMQRPELELCGIDDIDEMEVIYADPRMLDDEPADGVTLLYTLSGNTEKILGVTFDSRGDAYHATLDVKFVNPDATDAENVLVDPAKLSDEDFAEYMHSLALDGRPIQNSDIEEIKILLRKVEIGYGI